MSIEIIKIIDPGVGGMERLWLKASSTDNVGSYVVFDTVQTKPGSVSSKIKNTFWFPDDTVQAGDTIILYTKPGIKFQKKNDNGTTTRYYFWGREKTLWANTDAAAVLAKIGGWRYKTKV